MRTKVTVLWVCVVLCACCSCSRDADTEKDDTAQKEGVGGQAADDERPRGFLFTLYAVDIDLESRKGKLMVSHELKVRPGMSGQATMFTSDGRYPDTIGWDMAPDASTLLYIWA